MTVLLGRILLGALFVMAGFQKMSGIEAFTTFIESGPVPGFMAWPVAIFELVAGVLILVGFLTRYTALALALFCAATGFLYHPGETGMVLKNLAIAGGFLILFAHGPGLLSADARRGGDE